MPHRFTSSWPARQRMGAALLVLLISLLLSACGGSPRASASGSPTGTARLPSPTATSSPGAFQVVFYEQDTSTTCPPGQKKVSCLLFQGNGQAVGYGTLTMTRLEVVSPAIDSHSCQHVVDTGSLSTSKQDQIAFTATGFSCILADTVSLTYHISGGSGKYRGASGNGTIMVHATTLHQGFVAHRSESWNGMLIYPGQS